MEGSNGNGKFSPPANIPQQIALKWPDGRECQSPYNGDQVRFVLTDDRSWYLDLPTAARLRALQLSAGEVFTAERKEIARGNRRSYEWVLGKSTPPAPPPPQVQESTPTAPAATIRPPAQQQPNPTTPPEAPAARPIPMIDPLARFVDKGRMAIDAVLAIEAYAHQKGMPPFAFTADNLEKIWVHLSMQNGGR